MQGVTLPKAPSPTGVSGPGRRDLAKGPCPMLGPVPGQYLWHGLTTAATTGPAAAKGSPGCWALWKGRQDRERPRWVRPPLAHQGVETGSGVHPAPQGSTGTGIGDGSRSPCCAQRGAGGEGMGGTPLNLTCSGLTLPLAGAAGPPLLAVLLLLGLDPLHPAEQELLQSLLPQTTSPGAPPPTQPPPRGAPKCWWLRGWGVPGGPQNPLTAASAGPATSARLAGGRECSSGHWP